MKHSTSTEDASVVTLAANLLDVSEFEIFRASYKSWYCDEGSNALLERRFGEYLKHGDLPFWVRHFSREQLSQEREDEWQRGDLLAELEMILSLYVPLEKRAVSAYPFTLAA
jgi:hypothetical protein